MGGLWYYFHSLLSPKSGLMVSVLETGSGWVREDPKYVSQHVLFVKTALKVFWVPFSQSAKMLKNGWKSIENRYFNTASEPEKIRSIRYTQYAHFYFGLPGNDCTKDIKNSRRSRPPSAADFLCCFGVLNTVISWKSKIKMAYWVYLMQHIFFGLRLCVEISIFNWFSIFLALGLIGCRVPSFYFCI